MQRELPDNEYLQLLARDDATFRDQLVAWVRANGIDPSDVPAGERPSLVDGNLTVRMFTRTGEGRVQEDPTRPNEVLKHTITVPMTVAPEGQVARWLTPPCPGCGR